MWVRAGPVILFFLLILVSPVYADVASWDYFITEADQSMIDMPQTTAKIDNANHEITLKQILPRSVGLYENVMDYVVLSPDGFKHYSFDGTGMREVEFLGKDKVINPLAVCTSPLYPDAVLYDKDSNQVTHYSFMGGMVANPILSVSGMDNVISIGTRNLDLAFIQDKEVKYYGFTGIGLSSVPSLSKTLTNPIDFALFPNNYNMAVIDGNQIKYFKNGSEIPGSAITGLSNPISISANESGIAVVDGNQVKHYTLSGDTFTYTSVLSVASTEPRCVAIKPGTQDRVIVDGNDVKYYSYDGSGLVYNPALSTTVDGLNNLFVYIPNAVVISKVPEGLTRDVAQARVRAYCYVPEGTSITWFLTVDEEESWITCWRARGTPTGSVLETYDGTNWVNIGDATNAYPSNENIKLMFNFDPAGKYLKWKAQLQGTSKATPKVKAAGSSPAIKLDINTKPSKPIPDPDNKIPDTNNTCLITATPTLTWEFVDPDIGDQQTAYEIQVFTHDDTKVIPLTEGSNIVEGDLTEYTIPSDVLYHSGQYKFKYRVKVRDKGGLWSDYSVWKHFCVVAFESPRIREIVHPSTGQIAPDPKEPSTYIHILKGMLRGELPKTKAGGKVGLFLNGIGLDKPNITLKIPYKDKYAVFIEGHPVIQENIGTNNKFLLEFYTSSNPKICPDGTLIEGDFRGNNHNTYPKIFLSPKESLDSYDIDYYYADGLLTTEGTVLSDWMVVLQGRKDS